MSKKFCPKCGKTTERFYENLCKDCFLSKLSFSNLIPNKIVVRKCKICNRFFSKNRIVENVENAVELVLADLLIESKIKSATYRIDNNKVHISLITKVYGLEKTEEKVLSLIVKQIICKSCSMKSVGYYQSILQVRAPDNLLESVSKEVQHGIEFLSQYDELAFISKCERVAKGYDFYIGSKRSASEIAKNLKKKFNAKLKVSRKLSGSIRGKRVYKDTILISIGD